MRGITPQPTPDQLDSLTQRVHGRGGLRLSANCAGRVFNLSRLDGQPGARTRSCFCLATTRFELSYADGEGKYLACANCDAVGLQPAYQEALA